jgi:hypothetical protein
MRSSALSLFGAAALGFALAGAVFSTWAPRPARADSRVGLPIPIAGGPQSMMSGAPQQVPTQPLAVQALDPEHFVVVSREARLLTRDGKTAQNTIVTVVTHYTVRGDRLVPIENIRVPAGYQVVTVEE